MAPLVTDPIDQIQLEAIAAELSFFLVEDVPAKKRVGFVVEAARGAGRGGVRARVRSPSGRAPVPPELVRRRCSRRWTTTTRRCGVEAIYTLGMIARPPLAADATRRS